MLIAAICIGGYYGVDAFMGDDASSSDGGSDDDTEESSEPMSAGAGESLEAALEDADYACYDSLDDLVVHRCFFADPPNESDLLTGTVAIYYNANGDVGSISATAYASKGNKPARAVIRTTGKLVGEELLGGRPDDVAKVIRTSKELDEKDLRVSSSGGNSLFVYDPQFSSPQIPPPTYAEVDAVVASAEEFGLKCERDKDFLSCRGTVDDVDLGVTATITGDKAEYGWSVDGALGYEAEGDAETVMAAVTDLVEATEVFDSEAAGFIADYGTTRGASADIGGTNLSVTGTGTDDYPGLTLSQLPIS